MSDCMEEREDGFVKVIFSVELQYTEFTRIQKENSKTSFIISSQRKQ